MDSWSWTASRWTLDIGFCNEVVDTVLHLGAAHVIAALSTLETCWIRTCRAAVLCKGPLHLAKADCKQLLTGLRERAAAGHVCLDWPCPTC
jgi:hypothetical protein